MVESGGMAGGGFDYLEEGSGIYTSMQVEFNTTYQPTTAAGADQVFKVYLFGAGSIAAELAYNTMIAAPTSGKSVTVMMQIGNGSTKMTASIHDNYMDVSGADGPFYTGTNNDGFCSATYSSNTDLVSGQPFLTNP
jgi:hypothetical protein